MTSNQQLPLQGQTAVVTGGNRGIGAGIVRRLAELGALTFIVGRSEKSLEQTAQELRSKGHKCVTFKADVSHWGEIEELAQFVNKETGRCDILVNNAGVGAFGTPLHKLELHCWDEVMHTNLRGAFYCIRAFAPMMIEAHSGHIINISSIASKNALPNGAVYAASKWGLNGLSYSVAEELRNHNIRVAVICPGSTVSDLSPHLGKDPAKMLKPYDIAHAVEMLVTQKPESFISELILRPTQKP
jgi:NAD(P)-dependent dehydrogenase (short-subunit alcohol dehydrogenase family)